MGTATWRGSTESEALVVALPDDGDCPCAARSAVEIKTVCQDFMRCILLLLLSTHGNKQPNSDAVPKLIIEAIAPSFP